MDAVVVNSQVTAFEAIQWLRENKVGSDLQSEMASESPTAFPQLFSHPRCNYGHLRYPLSLLPSRSAP